MVVGRGGTRNLQGILLLNLNGYPSSVSISIFIVLLVFFRIIHNINGIKAIVKLSTVD